MSRAIGGRRNGAGVLLGCALLLAAMGFGGCGDDDSGPPVVPPDKLAPPTSVLVVNGDLSITVRWTASPDESAEDFKQYNIYRGTSSLLSIDPGQLEQLGHKIGSVGKGVGTIQTVVANGTLYYFHVRSVNEDSELSDASNEVMGAGRAEGQDKIIEEFSSSGDSGFDFSAGNSVALSQSNPDRFTLTDIYLGTGAADDDPGSVLSLKSPELLARLNSEWASKRAGVKFLGTNWEASTTDAAGFQTQMDVIQGAVYAIKTPSGHYAKIHVQTISGAAGSRAITFRYAYQATPNLIQF